MFTTKGLLQWQAKHGTRAARQMLGRRTRASAVLTFLILSSYSPTMATSPRAESLNRVTAEVNAA